MVSIALNRPEYLNDVSEVLRSYLGFVEIVPVDLSMAVNKPPDTCDYCVRVEFQGGETPWVHVLGKNERGDGARYSYPIQYEGDGPLLKKRQEKRAAKIAVFRCMRMLTPHVRLAWGSLTGIRPTKLLRELMDAYGDEKALSVFLNEFDVEPEKTDLAAQIVSAQQALLRSEDEKSFSVYIGIPFCRTRCLYCSFASEVVGTGGVPPIYLDALYEDIKRGAAVMREGGYRLRSMYLGGGTPTVLSAGQLHALLLHAACCYGGYGEELTVEAGRPDTLDEEKLCCMKEAGVTRISLNPQSMAEETLKRIGRDHTAEDIIKVYHMARAAGFDNINMDVIAGLPGETVADMAHTLREIEALGPESLTVHTLAIKRSSRLKEKLEEYRLPGADMAEEMVRMGAASARRMGMGPYYMYRQKYMRGNLENVGYAKGGKACLYNVHMMEEATSIMAHGAGAMTKRVFPGRDMRVERIPAPKDVITYCGKLRKLYEEKRGLFL